MNTPQNALGRYCYSRRGRASWIAVLLLVSPATVSNWIAGKREIPAKHVLAIEKITLGAVKAEQMRPDLKWKRTKKSRTTL